MRNTRWAITATVLLLALLISACAARPAADSGKGAPGPSPPAISAPVPAAATKSAAEAIKWNEQDPNVATNGNPLLAAGLLKNVTADDLRRRAADPAPGVLKKAPWQYYGKVVKLGGVVKEAQDFPRGAQTAKALDVDQLGEIVLACEDLTLVRYSYLGSVGDSKVGQTLTVYGYPVGLVEVEDGRGGKAGALAVVGKAIDR